MRPYTKIITILAAAGALALLAAPALSPRFRRRNWIIGALFLAGLCFGGFVSIAHGNTGYLAAKSPSVADLQKLFFELDANVRAIKQDTAVIREDTAALRQDSAKVMRTTEAVQASVERTGETVAALSKDAGSLKADTSAIRQQLEHGEEAEAERCSTMRCAVAMGASRQTFQRLMDGGAKLTLDMLGPRLRMLAESRNKNRFDIVDLYLTSGALPDVNANVLHLLLNDSLRDAAEESARKSQAADAGKRVAQPGCYIAVLRPLELAALVQDKQLYAWMIQRGADPNLTNHWCNADDLPFRAAGLAHS